MSDQKSELHSPLKPVSAAATPLLTRRVSLWSAQILLGLTFAGGGVWKLVTPLEEIAKLMPWTGEVEPAFFYSTAIFDLLGGLGIILPSLTRTQPKITVFAALGCLVLMGCAIVFHVSRGEAHDTPINFLLGGLCLFVIWASRSSTLSSQH